MPEEWCFSIKLCMSFIEFLKMIDKTYASSDSFILYVASSGAFHLLVKVTQILMCTYLTMIIIIVMYISLTFNLKQLYIH